jgi:hypothetical protein
MQIANKLEKVEESQKELKERVEASQKEVEASQNKVSFELNIEDLSSKIESMRNYQMFEEMNPWLAMTETDRSRVRNLRDAVFKELGIDNTTASCWLTGTLHKTKALKMAHIFPDSTKRKVYESLKLDKEFRNNVQAPRWNFMILREDIEEAFDSLRVSFVPRDVCHVNNFVLKVWDPTDVGEVIRNLDGHPLHVPSEKYLCRRALSYQTLCAYVTAKRRNPNLEIQEPDDLSSDLRVGNLCFANSWES